MVVQLNLCHSTLVLLFDVFMLTVLSYTFGLVLRFSVGERGAFLPPGATPGAMVVPPLAELKVFSHPVNWPQLAFADWGQGFLRPPVPNHSAIQALTKALQSSGLILGGGQCVPHPAIIITYSCPRSSHKHGRSKLQGLPC